MPRRNSIEIEYDEETPGYYIFWEPVIMGWGKTSQKALEDLRQAAHFGIDTSIDVKLTDIRELHRKKRR